MKAFTELFIDEPGTTWWKDPALPLFQEYKKSDHRRRPWNTFRYMCLLDRYPGSFQAVGFKLMYGQLARQPEILVKMILDGYRILHLVRDNCLDIVLSKENAKRGFVHERKPVDVGPIYLNPAAVLMHMTKEERRVKIARGLLSLLPLQSLEVRYESLCQDRDAVLSRVAGFLGVGSSGISYSGRLRKIARGPYRDRIANFEQVREALSRTRFASLLRE
jgi:hypothetical protein